MRQWVQKTKTGHGGGVFRRLADTSPSVGQRWPASHSPVTESPTRASAAEVGMAESRT